MVNPYPYYPPPPPEPPERPERPQGWGDTIACTLILVLTTLLWAMGAVFSGLILAFLDSCPPESCSADNASLAITSGVGIGLLLGLTGAVLVVLRIRRALLAWPFALLVMVAVLAAEVVGVVGYYAAVGAF